MIYAIQFIGILFGLFMLYVSFLHYKRKEYKTQEFIFWAAVWGLFVIISDVPHLLNPIWREIGINRALDFFVIVGFMFLLGISYYNYNLVRLQQKKLEKIVRKLAVENPQKK